MRTATKVGLGVVALAVAGLVAVRFGGSGAAKSGLDAALSNLPPGWAATHGAVTYDAMSGQAQVDRLVVTRDGQMVFTAGSVLASDIEGVSADAPPARIGKVVIKDLSWKANQHVGHLEIDGLELANWLTVFDAGSYPNGKPASANKLKLLTSIDGSDLQAHIDLPPPPPNANGPKISAVDVHVGHFHNDGVSARQFIKPPGNHSLQDYVFLSDAARAVSEDGGSAKDISETLPGIGRFTIGTASAAAISGGRIGSFEDRDIAFVADGKPDKFSLDRVGGKDIDLNKVLDQLPQLAVPGNASKLNAGMRIGEFGLNGLSADFEQSPLVTLTSLEGTTTDAGDGTQNGGLTMRGLKIATTGRDIKPQVKLGLDRFGMADFVIDLDETANYAPDNGHLKLSRADFTFHDLGLLHLALDADGLQNVSTPGADQAETLKAVHLTGATVQWTDNSLTNRVFKTVAAQTGKSVDELHAALVLPVASVGVFLPGQPDAGNQITAFLNDPKQLTITLAPPQPVSLWDVAHASAQEKAALLGVSVKGN